MSPICGSGPQSSALTWSTVALSSGIDQLRGGLPELLGQRIGQLQRQRAAHRKWFATAHHHSLADHITQQLGPRFYGFGFLGAAGITSLLALAVLSRRLERLDYETFMS